MGFKGGKIKMKLKESVLDKIRHLYEKASQISKYWVKIDLWQCDKYTYSELKIEVYTFIKNREKKQKVLYEATINLNELKAEQKIQLAIENIEELITPSTNEND